MERDLCVHDEILLEAPIEATDEVVLILKETKVRALFIYMPAEVIPSTLDIVRKLREKFPNEDMRAFTWMLEECC